MATVAEHALERSLTAAWPISAWSQSHVVVAVSGGPDSVGLLRAILSAKPRCGGKGKIFVAHFNHVVRGIAAEADEAWVAVLCRGLGVPVEVGRADAGAGTAIGRDGWEAAARAARYEFLRETAEKLGARYVAVGHTADDQVETVLHRILRGTGLEGLAGMPASRPLSSSVALVRPLLMVSRAAVLEYLRDIGQAFRMDDSNASLRWTRNRLRHELLPNLRERFNTGVDDALLRLATQAGEAQQIIANLATELSKACVYMEWSPGKATASATPEVRIDCPLLSATPPLLVREVCKIAWLEARWPVQAMGYEEWQQLAELILGMRQTPANLPGNIRARRVGPVLHLETCAGT